jgi:predicted nucleic acid-binding protein
MPAHLVDTNVLLRAIQVDNLPLRAAAREAVRELYRQGDVLCICPQNLIELWNVSTRPVSANGFGLTTQAAEKNMSTCERLFRLLPDTPEVFAEWKRLVTTHHVAGVKVHDARLVAAMCVHGISSILSFDTADFSRYPVQVLHPQQVLARRLG